MLFQFMANAHLYFPLTREQPEIHPLENRGQRVHGGPGRGGKPSACQPSQISFRLPARLVTQTAVSCIWTTAALIRHEGRFPCCMLLPVPLVHHRLHHQLRSCPWYLGVSCPGRWEGALLGPAVQWFSSPPSVTSSEWFSWCCHGNSPCSRRRGNVCGIQLLPDVGRREPAFHPVQVPTAGRDGRFKIGARGRKGMTLNDSSQTMPGN